MQKRWLYCALLWIPCVANAIQELTPDQAYSRFVVSGYVDGSYNYLLNSNQFTSDTYDRVFDLNQNGFTLQQATVTFAYTPLQGLGGLVNVVSGRDANALAPVGWNPDVFGKRDIGLVFPQAYVHYATNNFTIKVGELITLAGLEAYDYTKDTNFSRSILDGYAQPGSNIGIRGIKRFADHWKIILGVDNGWSTIENISHQKTLEFGLGYKQPEVIELALNCYSGQEYISGDVWNRQTGWRSLIDIYGTYNVNQHLSFAGNADYAMQTQSLLPQGVVGRATWAGIAGYVNYKFSEKWRTSVRVEVFYDSVGYRTGVKQNWREVTLTMGYFPIKAFEVRAETRHDFSNKNAFFQKNNLNTSVSQQSFAVEGLYRFDV